MMTKEDLAKIKMFKGVIQQGDFSIKGNAIVQVANLVIWFNGLEDRVIESLKEEIPPLMPKEVIEPIAPVEVINKKPSKKAGK